MYEMNYKGRTSYLSNYFYCRIRPEGLLCDAERDLFAIAKFLVSLLKQRNMFGSQVSPGPINRLVEQLVLRGSPWMRKGSEREYGRGVWGHYVHHIKGIDVHNIKDDKRNGNANRLMMCPLQRGETG